MQRSRVRVRRRRDCEAAVASAKEAESRKQYSSSSHTFSTNHTVLFQKKARFLLSIHCHVAAHDTSMYTANKTPNTSVSLGWGWGFCLLTSYLEPRVKKLPARRCAMLWSVPNWVVRMQSSPHRPANKCILRRRTSLHPGTQPYFSSYARDNPYSYTKSRLHAIA